MLKITYLRIALILVSKTINLRIALEAKVAKAISSHSKYCSLF